MPNPIRRYSLRSAACHSAIPIPQSLQNEHPCNGNDDKARGRGRARGDGLDADPPPRTHRWEIRFILYNVVPAAFRDDTSERVQLTVSI